MEFALIAVRPVYLDGGLRWCLEPRDDIRLPQAVVNAVIEAGAAARTFGECNDPGALTRIAGSLKNSLWRHRTVLRTLANALMSTAYIDTERLWEILQPVIDQRGAPTQVKTEKSPR
jgi:hypothetical protein